MLLMLNYCNQLFIFGTDKKNYKNMKVSTQSLKKEFLEINLNHSHKKKVLFPFLVTMLKNRNNKFNKNMDPNSVHTKC